MLLGSRIALGVYVPALSLKKELEARGDAADLICLEDLYEGRDAVIEESKRSFHRDFRLAKTSYRMPTRNRSAVDPLAVQSLRDRLAAEAYYAVVTFSGFWADFLKSLAAACPHYEGRIYAVHMDASYSLSWKGAEGGFINDIWLYELESGSVQRTLEAPDAGSEPQRRILVHGGGWGIGEYEGVIKLLNERGYPLDIVIYYPDEAGAEDDMNDYYLLDPGWRPDDKREEYPRLLKYEDGKWRQSVGGITKINPLRELMKRDAAVLSKPGGGTISDSLVTATPFIFNEELAYYERDNRLLWTEKGFGMSFDDFIRSEDTDAALQDMRRRLLSLHGALPTVAEVLQ